MADNAVVPANIHHLYDDVVHHLLSFFGLDDIGRIAAVDRTFNSAIHTMAIQRFDFVWSYARSARMHAYRSQMYPTAAPVAVVPLSAAGIALAIIDAAAAPDVDMDDVIPFALQDPVLPAAPTTPTAPNQWAMRSDNMNLTRPHVRSLDFNGGRGPSSHLLPRRIIRELGDSFPRLLRLALDVSVFNLFKTYAQSGGRSLFPRTLTDLDIRLCSLGAGMMTFDMEENGVEDEWNAIGSFELVTGLAIVPHALPPSAARRLASFNVVKAWMTHIAAIPQLHTLRVGGRYLSSTLLTPEMAVALTTRSSLAPFINNQSITSINIDIVPGNVEGLLQTNAHAHVLATFGSLRTIGYTNILIGASHNFVGGLLNHTNQAFRSRLRTLIVPTLDLDAERAAQFVQLMVGIQSLECDSIHSGSIISLANLDMQSLTFAPTVYYNTISGLPLSDDRARAKVGQIVAGLSAMTQLTQLTLMFKHFQIDTSTAWHEVQLNEANMVAILTPLVNLRSLTIDGYLHGRSEVPGFQYLVDSGADQRLEHLTMRRHRRDPVDKMVNRVPIEAFATVIEGMPRLETLLLVDVFIFVPIEVQNAMNTAHPNFHRDYFPRLKKCTFECTCRQHSSAVNGEVCPHIGR